jgi:AraC-like DNA-binding protein
MQVSVMMVRFLAGALERRGESRPRFLEAAGLETRVVEDDRARLPLSDYLRALETAIVMSNDAAFGLYLGEYASATMFDVLGPLATQSATLRQAIDMSERYAKLVAQGFGPELAESTDTASIRFPALRGEHPAVRVTAEFGLTALLGLTHVFLGETLAPAAARFAYPKPPYAPEYERIFGAAVQFDQEVTELVVPRSWLDRAHGYHSRELHALLQARAELLLARLARTTAFCDRVLEILNRYPPAEMPAMSRVARELHLSARTLRRKLVVERTTFAALVERTLLSKAKRMLEDPAATIQETAYAMGFAAPAAFHRAFKRWTGLTPKEYQDTL